MPQSPASQFSGIFVSYRRDDSSGHAGRLFDNLAEHFGKDRIFMDIDTIEAGEDFVEVIEKAVSSCKILIAVIGRHWLSDSIKLNNPNDFLRLEIATALRRDIRVIPVLVQRATMPSPDQLPEDLVKLSRRNAVELSDIRWQHDVEQLIGVLEKKLDTVEGSPGPHGSERHDPADTSRGALQGIGRPQRMPLLLFLAGIILAAILWVWMKQIPVPEPGPNYNASPVPSPFPTGSPDHTLSLSENITRGDELYKNKRYSEAEGYFREAVRLQPDDSGNNNRLGLALYFQKKYAEAERCFYEAVRLDPDAAFLHSNLGDALYFQQRYPEAENRYREALKKKPNEPQYEESLGNALYSQQKYAEAESHLRAALPQRTNAGAHNRLGSTLYYQKKYAEAEVEFREAVKMNPGDAELQNNLGNALWRQGKTIEAAPFYREAVRLDPNNRTFEENLQRANAVQR